MDVATEKEKALLKEENGERNGGKRGRALFQVPRSRGLTRGPENGAAPSRVFVVLLSLAAPASAHIRDQAGCDDLTAAKRIKPETGVSDVPKPRTEAPSYSAFSLR